MIAIFDGFGVSRCDRGETHLVGWVPDQAALRGTLEMLRDLNIELVSVNPSWAERSCCGNVVQRRAVPTVSPVACSGKLPEVT